jgi:hypothetical protein
MTRFTIAAACALLLNSAAADAQDVVRYRVSPQHADPAIRRFTATNYIVFEKGVSDSAPLLLFMPGTGGQPERSTDFADVAAHQGYRVIGLMYNDEPAVMQICPRDPDPRCAEKFRQKRVFGDVRFDAIEQDANESIVRRLVALLTTLEREHPGEGWAGYMEAGAPKWTRIAVSGLSQGAGMAAFIAQKTRVARVILFSSPWDNYGARKTFSPWLTAGSGATPAKDWYATYHAKEPTADLIARAYQLLRIPAANVRVFTREPNGAALYHPSGVANGGTPRNADGSPAYLPDWKFVLGEPRG